MGNFIDKVHIVGMSESGSTYMTVSQVSDANNKVVRIEPPIQVVLEGEAARVVVSQDGLAARYHDDELRQIGEGSSMLGLDRVIGDIAMNGNLEYDATKPLHPNMLDAQVVEPLELIAPVRELTA